MQLKCTVQIENLITLNICRSFILHRAENRIVNVSDQISYHIYSTKYIACCTKYLSSQT